MGLKMDFKSFEKSLEMLVYLNGAKIEKHKNKLFFEVMKDEFSDFEFAEICKDICKTEDLYGKYPTLKMFYDRKEPDPSTSVLIVQGQFYIDDTMPEYRPYLQGMTDKEIEDVWKWIYNAKYGETVEKKWIIDIIKKFNANKSTARSEIGQNSYSDEVSSLIGNSVKMIEQ